MREWITPTILVLGFTVAVAFAGPTVDELSRFADGDAAAIFRPEPGITLEELAKARKVTILVYDPPRHFPCDPSEPIPKQTVVKVPGNFYARFEESIPEKTCIWTQTQWWCENWTEYPEKGGEYLGRIMAQKKSGGGWGCE